MSQQEINRIEDWESEELSESELDALAGGALRALALDLTLFSVDAAPIMLNTDSLFTSYVGARGTTDPAITGSQPFNMSLSFP